MWGWDFVPSKPEICPLDSKSRDAQYYLVHGFSGSPFGGGRSGPVARLTWVRSRPVVLGCVLGRCMNLLASAQWIARSI